MNPPNQLTPALAPTPRTDAAYFANGATMYSLAGEMKLLERELTAAKAERDLIITRVACIVWSGAIDKHTCGDVQKWADHYIAELTRLRAEVDSLKAWKARAEKAEAALAFIAENGGTTHETECGTISCNGLWCAEQARAAIDAARKEQP
jgi:hypothetical protein